LMFALKKLEERGLVKDYYLLVPLSWE